MMMMTMMIEMMMRLLLRMRLLMMMMDDNNTNSNAANSLAGAVAMSFWTTRWRTAVHPSAARCTWRVSLVVLFLPSLMWSNVCDVAA
jgi:hypothetical protein